MSSKMKTQASLLVVLCAVCCVWSVGVGVGVHCVFVARVCLCGVWCVVCSAAWHAGKNVYVQNAYVCNGKTPACVQHAGVLSVHTETFLNVHTGRFSLFSLSSHSLCLSSSPSFSLFLFLSSFILPVSLALALPFSLSLVKLRSFCISTSTSTIYNFHIYTHTSFSRHRQQILQTKYPPKCFCNLMDMTIFTHTQHQEMPLEHPYSVTNSATFQSLRFEVSSSGPRSNHFPVILPYSKIAPPGKNGQVIFSFQKKLWEKKNVRFGF